MRAIEFAKLIGLPTARLKPSDIPKEEMFRFVPPTNAEESKCRMLKNNPMKNPRIAAQVRKCNLGRPAHNKIGKLYTWHCDECGVAHKDRDTAHNRLKRFCDKSCAVVFSNKKRTGIKYGRK